MYELVYYSSSISKSSTLASMIVFRALYKQVLCTLFILPTRVVVVAVNDCCTYYESRVAVCIIY